ncbi:MAG: dolichol-phosphate mannosyltransferase [Actinotalea sp.]|nr:dolichol-phosphate mannosyltransferase [Actinotalea sp.]
MAEPTRVLVVVPTYNERQNLEGLVRRIRAAVPRVEVLVVDDGSPDGTGDLADAIAARDPQVSVLHRTSKQGLGSAYLAGFARAFELDVDAVVEMDADGSHQPEQLADLLAALADPDVGVVLGSRWVPGGRIVNWPWHRVLLSKAGSAYARTALGLAVRDVTGGFRVYRTDVLRALVAEGVESQGYCFQIDLVRRAVAARMRVVEVPITFVEREVGESKMNRSIVVEAVVRVTGWGLRRLVPDRRRGLRPALQARAG